MKLSRFLTSVVAGSSLMITGAPLVGVQDIAHAQESLAGVGAATGVAAGLGAASVTNIRPKDVTGRLPAGGAGDGTEGLETGVGPDGTTTTQTTTTTYTRRVPVRMNTLTGSGIISELLRPQRTVRATPTRRTLSPRARAAESRRLARMTPAQRKRATQAKYQIAPKGWLGYYLPQDRYKVSSQIWQFVSIEDDSRAYPVRYYYRPWSASMLRLLSQTPKNGQRRYNRVIGFRTWQDAMLAGYRPDPVSRPEPSGSIVYLARLARTPQLERYVEFIYSGQVRPADLDFSVRYVRVVERIVRSRPDTQPLMAATVGQAIGAILGENAPPTSVGGPPPAPVQPQENMEGGPADQMGPDGQPMPPG